MPSGYKISGPGAAWNFVTVTQSGTPAIKSWNLVTTSGVTLTLPVGAPVNSRIAVTRFHVAAGEIYVQAGSGDTINGATSALFLDAAYNIAPSVILIKVSATAWQVESMAGSDLVTGFLITGILEVGGGLVTAAGTFTANQIIASYHNVMLVNGSGITMTFGTALGTGQHVWISNIGSSTVTIAVAGEGTLQGSTSLLEGTTAHYFVQYAGPNPIVLQFYVN